MNTRFPLIPFLPLTLLALLLITTCSGTENKSDTVTGLHPIDIQSGKFFWLLQPWKEGKLATIDGRARFAEISFVGANRMRIKPLCNFPRMQLDRELITWPEAGLIASTSGKMHHLAAIDDNKTKSHAPLLSWVHFGGEPVLLDSREGLVGHTYFLDRNRNDVETSLFMYNYKEDRMVYKSPEGFAIGMLRAMDNQCALSWHRTLSGNKKITLRKFYNWRTHTIVENDLTDVLNRHHVDLTIGPCRNIHPARRYLFGYSVVDSRKLKITWDEEYSDIKVIPLSYLEPEGKSFDDLILSANGSWATTFVHGYRGLRNEWLCKRAFFHLDGRYPNGISIPIITEDYEGGQWDYSAFVEHPVHGMCFAQEWYKEGQLYLRLYKMSEVLAEINRQLAE
ncbi:MAG: hypothetical protein LBI14_10860 [Treponema sp.]|jgi:hypothetical protein|nr:hypothetical protein [Treponema sp.]